MKILATNDLHGYMPWYQWIKEVAPDFDVIVLSGDLIQQKSQLLMEQAMEVYKWINSWPKNFPPLILASGNHDYNTEGFQYHKLFDDRYSLVATPNWIGRAATSKNVIGPGSLYQSENIVFVPTEYPHNSAMGQQYNLIQIRKAATLASQLVLIHHCPPIYIKGREDESEWAGQIIKQFKPTIMFCGHIHELPYQYGASFKHEETQCITAGQLTPEAGDGIRPNFVTVNTEDNDIWWNFFENTKKCNLIPYTYGNVTK